jgi:hypothetical protein
LSLEVEDPLGVIGKEVETIKLGGGCLESRVERMD